MKFLAFSALILGCLFASCGSSPAEQYRAACEGHGGVRGTSANGHLAICMDGTVRDE